MTSLLLSLTNKFHKEEDGGALMESLIMLAALAYGLALIAPKVSVFLDGMFSEEQPRDFVFDGQKPNTLIK